MESFDLLKGVAIYLVVMGHVLTMCIRDIDSAVAFKLIGEIHMPVFFFISGYFTYKVSGGRDFAAPGLWRRFKQLIVPFVVVGSLWMVYFPHSKLHSPLSGSIPEMLVSYWKDGYWFTLTLFELMLLYAGLGKLLRLLRRGALQAAALVAVYAGLLAAAPLISDASANYDPVGIGLLARFFPIFAAGVFARKYASGFRRLAENTWCFAVSAAVFFCAWYYSAYWWEFPGLPEGTIHAAQPLLHGSLMLLVFGLVYRAGAPTGKSAVRRWFVLLGNNSLGIYLLHYFFLFPLTPLQEVLRSVELSFLPTVMTAAFFAFFIVLATLGAVYAVGKNRILSSLLIGKSLKKERK